MNNAGTNLVGGTTVGVTGCEERASEVGGAFVYQILLLGPGAGVGAEQWLLLPCVLLLPGACS